MKKTLRIILIVLIAAALGLGALYFYYDSREVRTFATEDIVFNGTDIREYEQRWTHPVLKFFMKELVLKPEKERVNELGTLRSLPLELELPDDAQSTYEVLYAGKSIAKGEGSEYKNFEYKENGPYEIRVVLHYDATENTDSADIYYSLQFGLQIDPTIEYSATDCLQGNILVIKYTKGLDDYRPEVETALGEAIFIPQGDGQWIAYVPVGFAQTPGKYNVTVTSGRFSETKTVTVSKREYEEQHMTISSSTVASTTGADANADYNEKIPPTFEIFDGEKYWTKAFIQPVNGRITTQFGLYRYTNGSKTAVRHAGIDIAAELGTPVPASNDGRVVFAGEVIRTGNSVVIEHGGGLKTYYYHLDSISVKPGDMVKQGDIIGKVGTTGYSTGPHLHFEVRLGAYPLSPWELIDGTSDVYKY
ncbi:MAG: M23 family metallopeptidase [Firmicutes bacterium]|nr:M23 family metallopeptidase [Bacillota bacterium]